MFFVNVIDGLDKKIQNEQTRYKIGELIVKEINSIESRFYQIAVAMNMKAGELIAKEIKDDIKDIKGALNVLEDGGFIEEEIKLNVANKDLIIQKFEYFPIDNELFILESIDLKPKLEEIEEKTYALLEKIGVLANDTKRDSTKDTTDIYEDIQLFLKMNKPLFVRMKENASRMLFESKHRAEFLTEEISSQKWMYEKLEIGVIAFIILITGAFGLLVSKGIIRQNRELEDAIKEAKELAKKAEESKIEAQRAEAAKGMFLANMSHEIRTPLNGIIGFADILKNEQLQPKHKEYINVIHMSAKGLLSIINDILDISKINSGNFTIEHVEFSPIESFEQTAEMFAARASEKRLDFIFKVDQSIPECLIGDRSRIQQVLVNLLGNAIKFTPEGGKIKFEIECTHKDEERVKILFSVKDSGIGISTENQKKIFEPFTQADGSITRKFGGTGLGLNISKNVIEQMGSKIELESKENEGSRFYFELELKICQKDSSALNSKNRLHIGVCRAGEDNWEQVSVTIKYIENLAQISYTDCVDSGLDAIVVHSGETLKEDLKKCKTKFYNTPVLLIAKAGNLEIDQETKNLVSDTIHQPIHPSKILDSIMNIMDKKEPIKEEITQKIEDDKEKATFEGKLIVAEDNAVNMKLVTILLKQLGITPLCAKDGLEAIEIYKQNGANLILMDINMPNLNGDEATEHIRAYEREHNIKYVPIVALTANAIKGDRERFLSCGMDDYLTKPIDAQKLKDMVKKYLSHKKEIETKSEEREKYTLELLAKKLGLPAQVCEMLLKNFFLSIENDLSELLEYIKNKNSEGVKNKSHYIKSSCLNLRMEKAAALLQDIEGCEWEKNLEEVFLNLEEEISNIRKDTQF